MSKPKKLQQQCIKNRNDITTMMIYWSLMGVLMLQQIKTTNAVKYNDSCVTKSQPGICKTWSECPILKTLIDRGEYTSREVVSCGFEIRDEIICCPVIRTENKIETTTGANTDRTDIFVIPTTTTPEPERDFWMDLLDNINATTTTKAPDFWEDLLTTSTTTTTTTTTTMKPLIVGEQRLNESSEFFDFNALLNQNQGGSQKRQINDAEFQGNNQKNSGPVNTNSNNGNSNRRPNNQNTGFVRSNNNNNNNRGINLNSGPINLNQWNFGEPTQNQRGNNGRGHQNKGNNGFNGWGQQNNGNSNFRGNNGNNNFKGNNGNNGNIGRGQNNGHGQNRNVQRNSNRGFVFPTDNGGPNQFSDFNNNGPPQRRPNMPVNDMNEQNPNRRVTNADENDNVDDLIKKVFNTNQNYQSNQPINPNTNSGRNIDDLVTNIFETPQTQRNQNNFNAFPNQPQTWVNAPNHPSNQVEFINPHMPNNQVKFVDGHQHSAGFQILPALETSMNNNDLEPAPSTNFAQHVSHNPSMHQPEFNPIQRVYENLVNSGMDIVKLQANHVENAWNSQQQQFGNRPQIQPSQTQFAHQQIPTQFGQFSTSQVLQPSQQFVRHPVQPSQQFVQQPVRPSQQFVQQQQFGQQPSQQFVQQPQFGQQLSQQFVQQPQFGQQPSQQFVQQPQSGQQTSQFGQEPLQTAQSPKDSRSAQQLQFAKSPIVQSPPTNIMDPFKPFEFRPPPEDEINFSEDNNSLSPDSGNNSANKERPAVRACRRIEKGLIPGLSPHILGGTPAELGEFPHMAAIGYSRIGGDNRPPYDIRCGGTLIDKRFVLTAAHCVTNRESVPSIIRLGVVNFTDVEQMKEAVEIGIKETYIHEDYSTSRTYNDIAILELEREVEISDVIYPVCLYTNETDPDTKIKLWVSGWGTINTTTRMVSDILLKAPLHTTPLERCNQSFAEYGLNRKIPQGIIRTQFCAEDKDQIKDACQGDSGGPLHLVVDESFKNYRLVGVISSGFGCASSTPGLYTRVAAFLDFIEKIVWPNGGD